MLNLMSLETKKINFKTYGIIFFIMNLVFIGLNTVTLFVYNSEEMSALTGAAPGSINAYELLFETLPTQSLQFLLVFVAIFANDLFVKEYKKGTIRSLYTSPINRKKFVLSKTILFIIVSFLTITVSVVLQGGAAYGIGEILNIQGASLDKDVIVTFIQSTGKVALASSLAVLLPVYLGLKRKSTGILIGVSIAVAVLLGIGNISMSMNGTEMKEVIDTLKMIENAVQIGIPIVGVALMGLFIAKDVNKDIVA